MDVILIAAISQDGYIAHHSQEKITWSKDLYLFKKQTMGWPVIMGSNTFGCIQKELKGMKIIDNFDNTTEIEFLRVSQNVNINEAIFLFNTPEDIDVIRN